MEPNKNFQMKMEANGNRESQSVWGTLSFSRKGLDLFSKIFGIFLDNFRNQPKPVELE